MSDTTRFIYLIALYNEEEILPGLVARASALVARFPGSLVCLLDNGSTDGTWRLIQDCAERHPGWLAGYHDDDKGMGVAYRRGLTEVTRTAFNPPLCGSDWVVLTAADLPFGFSDVDSVMSLPPVERRKCALIVGSKTHPASQVQRDFKRWIGSLVFRLLRWSILGITTRDTQGTLFIRADLVSTFLPIRANDFFVSVEIVDKAERAGMVREVPVVLEAELRSSRVRLGRDGWRMFRQLLRYRTERPAVVPVQSATLRQSTRYSSTKLE